MHPPTTLLSFAFKKNLFNSVFFSSHFSKDRPRPKCLIAELCRSGESVWDRGFPIIPI